MNERAMGNLLQSILFFLSWDKARMNLPFDNGMIGSMEMKDV